MTAHPLPAMRLKPPRRRFGDAMGLVVLILATIITPLAAESRVIAAPAESRVALVIGNSDYPGDDRLPLAVKDAATVSAALRSIGFDVTMIQNADRRSMLEALNAFRAKAAASDIALLYYSGRGMEHAGRNYLVPLAAKRPTAELLDLEAVPVSMAIEVAKAKNQALVVIDAQAETPGARQDPNSPWRLSVKGLAREQPDTNVVLVFSTVPQMAIAADGSVSSYFARSFSKRITAPDVELIETLRRVQSDVSLLLNDPLLGGDASAIISGATTIPLYFGNTVSSLPVEPSRPDPGTPPMKPPVKR